MDIRTMTNEELMEIISDAKSELESRKIKISEKYFKKLIKIMNEIKNNGFFIRLRYTLEEDCIIDSSCVYLDVYGDDEDDENYLFENLWRVDFNLLFF